MTTLNGVSYRRRKSDVTPNQWPWRVFLILIVLIVIANSFLVIDKLTKDVSNRTQQTTKRCDK